MPTTKDFKPKKAKAAARAAGRDEALDTVVDAAPATKRRPGRELDSDIEETADHAAADESQQQLHMKIENEDTVADAAVDGDAPVREGQTASAHKARSGSDEDLARLEREAEESDSAPKIEISFKGSELLRSRFPTPFALVEAVATDWVYGGEFDKLPINQPLAKFAAQQGLLKAKEVEKKVMESPAVEKAAMQILTAGMKAQGMVSQLREKLKR